MSLDQEVFNIVLAALVEHADGITVHHSLGSGDDKTLAMTLVVGECQGGPATPLSEEAEQAVSKAHDSILEAMGGVSCET